MPRQLCYDRILCAAVIALTFFGLLMVFSVTTVGGEISVMRVLKQTIAAGIGFALMRWLMFGDYRDWRNQKTVFTVLGASVILLVAAFLFGVGANTSRFLRFGQLSFQPSELAKLSLILFLAYYLETVGDRLDSLRSLAGGGLILGALCLLVFGGRDLGTAVSMMIIAAAILWVAGLETRYFLLGAGLAAPLVGLAIYLEPYRWERLMIFRNPESDPLGAGFQIIQSTIAVGSGGVTGAGLMLGRQKMSFLPEAHTDFIFASVAEELGLVGCLFVIAAFGVILWRGLRTAMRAPDAFGRYLAVGVTALIVSQALINMGVVLALLPTKGMPLPFISYGGSSMMMTLAAAGVLLNVSQHAE